MTVAGIEKVIPALGIEKMLEEGVPQATLDRVAPGVKTQDLNKMFGALDRAIPGLGKVVKQNANAGVAAGINSLGKEAELEGKKARAFPLRFVDGAVLLGPLKVGQFPPLFLRARTNRYGFTASAVFGATRGSHAQSTTHKECLARDE